MFYDTDKGLFTLAMRLNGLFCKIMIIRVTNPIIMNIPITNMVKKSETDTGQGYIYGTSLYSLFVF